jgi:hypothetical protein
MGRLLKFSAYSILLYLNDDFEGGNTTFFPEDPNNTSVRSRRGNTRLVDAVHPNQTNNHSDKSDKSDKDDDKDKDKDKDKDSVLPKNLIQNGLNGFIEGGERPEVRVPVVPMIGDCLVFPHGRQHGCHPDPLHEGSVVIRGRKTIIRSDIMFDNDTRRHCNKQQNREKIKK